MVVVVVVSSAGHTLSTSTSSKSIKEGIKEYHS